jgi:hypothetical protein
MSMPDRRGRRFIALFIALGAAVGCSGNQSLGDNDDGPPSDGGLDAAFDATPTPDTGDGTAVSHGPKIFITSTGHVADFIDDTQLAGTTVIEKADALCNGDPNKPDDGTYKALFVDGVNRSATPAIDWVLQPSTTYYLSHGDLVIGTTTNASIFDTAHQPLTHPIGSTAGDADPDDVDQIWTGIGSSVDFSTGTTCDGWTGGGDAGPSGDGGASGDAAAGAASGSRGLSTSTSGDAFHAVGDYGCTFFQLYLYCVEQP